MYSLPSKRFYGKPTASTGTGFSGPGGLALIGALALAISTFAATPARAAAKRCDWHGPLSGGEKPYAKCVDFASMEGKTIALP
ncbi:MAG: hypothetical protein ABIW76_14665, partial [Fibrobacteria bacterium]